MTYKFKQVAELAKTLAQDFEKLEDKELILKDSRLTTILRAIKDQPDSDKKAFGMEVNQLKQEIIENVSVWKSANVKDTRPAIDVTAPFGIGQTDPPGLLGVGFGSKHPVMTAQDEILDIFYRMGFTAVESRLIEDNYHMFDSLNFAKDHPARDDYDTFQIDFKDKNGDALVAPAHTSTMQTRVISAGKEVLEAGETISAVVPGRVFRNEDLDARHEHTFYQIEGIYVGKNVTVSNLIATLKSFMEEYYGKDVDIKLQPFYFPFTEPSFEMAISCPFCNKKGCRICGEGWIELLGCGLIHPNVLKEAGVDPDVYTGFAFGIGFMRMVMIKYDIEDIRHFQSAKLAFLRQFA